jgi:hypothetical protein
MDDLFQKKEPSPPGYLRGRSARGALDGIAPKGEVDIHRPGLRSKAQSTEAGGREVCQPWQKLRMVRFGLANSWRHLGNWATKGWLNRRVLPPPSDLLPYLLTGNLAAGLGEGQTALGGAIVDTLWNLPETMTTSPSTSTRLF